MISVGYNARHLAYPQMRGLTRYTVELLRALCRLGSVRLVLFSDLPLCRTHLEGIDAEVVVFSAARQLLWECAALPAKIKACGVDVFHAPADRGLPARKVCPLVVTVHDSYERTHWRSLMPGNKRKLRYWLHEGINYFLSDAVITVSDSTRDEMISLKVAPAKKLVRIHNGVQDPFNATGGPDDERVVSSHGIVRPYALYVGGYDRRKNVDGLVEAFARAGMADHSLVILAAKPANFAEKLAAWKRLGCLERIHFLEVADNELPSFYRRAEFFVNPSLWESFSLQLLEAMACGTPVASSDRKALPEIVGDAGIFFDPANDSALQAAMRRLAEDAPLRADLRERGLQRAASLSWEQTARRTLSVYKKVIGNGNRHN